MSLKEFEKKRNEKFHKQIKKQMERKTQPNESLLNKKDLDELTINNGKRFVSKNEIKKINNENYEVVKDNRLIQKATFDFKAVEMKCLNFSLSKLNPLKIYNENDWIEFPLKDLCKILKLKNNSGSIEVVKESLHNLRTISKWVKIENEKEKKIKDLSFFRDVEIDTKNKNNYIVKIQFMKEILDYLQNLKTNFTKELVIYTMRLKSKYAIRLYELCKSYQNNFIEQLNIFGFNFYLELMRNKWVLPSNYTNGKIKQILDKAIQEINNKTDIEISIFDTHKTNKKIDYYVIDIKNNSNFHNIYKEIEKERAV